ncbi:hypothetical protein WNY77_18650 [Paraglaciecola mesophila]|jgi:hypothetical protein|uniref:Uncharacterized protein n=2 Tax=Paraglaciecola mesophila TaxID=197222 RepID=K6YRC9_9ALTE|nr:hypothetical protein [Paraglaciecola mesophila]GAC26541.1 hypothetical protein GMES_4270 [Paraglaciecola mesophila KMM 241]|tara:strand:- start:5210 stop:5416 length:207 start_codon:yes stop_codon:yes gene_type:complete
MKGSAFSINGVHFYSMTNYYFIVKTDEVENITAVANSDLLNQLYDKIDPQILDAATQASDLISSSTLA